MPYGVPGPTAEVRAWKEALAAAGVTLFILSNNRHPQRPERFANALGTPFLGHAGKAEARRVLPGPWSRWAARRSTPPSWGDQIFTDILGGRNAGVLTLAG